MKIIVSHLTGNANVKAAIKGFTNEDLLKAYYTSVAVFPGTLLDRIGGLGGPFREMKRRQLDSSLQQYTKVWPWLELGRILSLKAGISKLNQYEDSLFNINNVSQSFDKHVAASLNKIADYKNDIVYAYEDTAMHTFARAKELRIGCFYDLPIGYWRAARRLLEAERERWPEWEATLTGLKDSDEKLARKDEELRLADQIFVASSFTAETLKDYPGKLAPVSVIPYGFPPVINERSYPKNDGKSPLKLLFVGGLSQRKGIADLIAVADKLGRHVQLTIVGSKKNDDCAPLNNALSRYKWIPSLPHAEILKLMREHDVFVFPSLFEGFGLVITEAMSQGTPVITTDRTIGPDIIVHEQNGWLIKAGSTEALQQAVENVLEKRNSLIEVSQAAMETARNRPWACYSDELAKAVNKNK